MAGVLQHLRSSTLNKRPNPASMVDGQVAINYASGSPGMFFKDSNGSLVKVGPVHVGSGAPNAVPASGGTAGNSLGEQWLDTSGGTYVFKIWDGAAWRSEAGEFVNVTGDTMTGALGIIAGSAASPSLFISGDANTGLYSPGADQLAISTNGTGRLFVNSAGNVGIGTSTAPSTNGLGLAIYDASLPRLTFRNSTTGDGTGDGTQLVQDGLNFNFANTESGSIKFFTANTERAVIDSSGRLGLGTSSPATGLSLETFGTQLESATNGYYMPSGRMYSLLGRVTSGTDSWVGFIAPYGNSSGSCNILLQPQFNNTSQQAGTYIGGEADSANTSVLTFGHMVASSSLTGTSTKLERVRIDNAGRVGIGVTGPGHALQVNGAICATGTFGTASASTVVLDVSGDARILTTGPSGGGYNPLAFAQVNSSGGGYTERARIDSSGRLLVGTSTAVDSEKSLTVVGDQQSIGKGVAHIKSTGTGFGADDAPVLVLSKDRTTTSSSARFLQFYASGTSQAMGWIGGNGANNVQFVSSSDIREKENIAAVKGALSKVMSLSVVSFDWKNNKEHVKAGFIAQDVEKNFPEYVVENALNEDSEARKGITGGMSAGYIAVLTAALQEAVTKIETLENKVAALEAQ